MEDGRGAEATGLSDPKAASSKNAAEAEEQRFALDVKIQTKHAEWEKAKQVGSIKCDRPSILSRKNILRGRVSPSARHTKGSRSFLRLYSVPGIQY